MIASGTSHDLVETWFMRRSFDVVVCPRLCAEIEGVLARPRFASRIDLGTSRAVVEAIRAGAVMRPDPPPQDAPICRDADDDYVIVLAREARADVIVSGDRDLLEWPEQHPPVVSPAQMSELLAGEM